MAMTEVGRPDLSAQGVGHEAPVALGQLVRLIAAAASLGAAAVHASAIAQHTADPFHALAFIGMTVFQAWWAYLVLRATTARVLIGGAIGHGSVVLLWLLSRTSGSPEWFPGASGREPLGLKDVVATTLAVVALVSIDLLSRRDLSARMIRATRAGATVGAIVIATLVLAAAGSFAAGHVHTGTAQHAVTPHGH
jgi:hypothetical protein